MTYTIPMDLDQDLPVSRKVYQQLGEELSRLREQLRIAVEVIQLGVGIYEAPVGIPSNEFYEKLKSTITRIKALENGDGE